MACLSAEQRALILAEIETKKELLDAANDALLSLIPKTKESYKFDSNEGSQQAKFRKLKEYRELIGELEAEINLLYRKLNCGGVSNMTIRRKYGFYGRRRY